MHQEPLSDSHALSARLEKVSRISPTDISLKHLRRRIRHHDHVQDDQVEITLMIVGYMTYLVITLDIYDVIASKWQHMIWPRWQDAKCCDYPTWNLIFRMAIPGSQLKKA